MPIELEIIRAAEFIRLGTAGKFDLNSSRAVLAGLAQACKRRGIDRALVDTRNAQAELSPAELASMVKVFREVGFGKNQRLAILHAAERYERAHLFAFISRMKGFNVRAFGQFEDALYWLSDSEEKIQPQTGASAKRLPVTHYDGDAKPVAVKSHSHRKHEHHMHVAHHQDGPG
jgi:hypothetical protein